MNCGSCNYAMDDLDTTCRRCGWKVGDAVRPPAPTPPSLAARSRKPAAPSRPGTITGLVILGEIVGLFLLGMGALLLLAVSRAAPVAGEAMPPGAAQVVTGGGTVLAVLGLACVVVLPFVWQGFRWARVTTMIIGGLIGLTAIPAIEGPGAPFAIFRCIIAGAFIGALIRPESKEYCSR